MTGRVARWVVLIGMYLLVIAQVVYAQQQGGLFGNITNLLCKIAGDLSGPIALAIGLVGIAGSGIAVAAGGRRALGTAVWVLIGTAIALGAETILSAAFNRAACK